MCLDGYVEFCSNATEVVFIFFNSFNGMLLERRRIKTNVGGSDALMQVGQKWVKRLHSGAIWVGLLHMVGLPTTHGKYHMAIMY